MNIYNKKESYFHLYRYLAKALLRTHKGGFLQQQMHIYPLWCGATEVLKVSPPLFGLFTIGRLVPFVGAYSQ